jgi:hypothetical protein
MEDDNNVIFKRERERERERDEGKEKEKTVERGKKRNM